VDLQNARHLVGEKQGDPWLSSARKLLGFVQCTDYLHRMVSRFAVSCFDDMARKQSLLGPSDMPRTKEEAPVMLSSVDSGGAYTGRVSTTLHLRNSSLISNLGLIGGGFNER
jgi:hypothetical protein